MHTLDALAAQSTPPTVIVDLVDPVSYPVLSSSPEPRLASPTQDAGPPSSSRQQPQPQEEPDTTLTPVRAHYLKKTLIQLQFSHELAAITSSPASALPNLSTLSYLGPPFSPPPKGAPALDLPFLRYIFRQFVLTFPFLAAAPRDFFPDKVQPFVASVLARNLSSPSSILGDGPDSASNSSSAEDNSQKKIMAKLERSLALFVNYATKIAEREEVVRLAQADLDRLELLARRRRARLARMQDVFDVNIVCVRTVVEKGRVRSRVHEVRSHILASSHTSFDPRRLTSS